MSRSSGSVVGIPRDRRLRQRPPQPRDRPRAVGRPDAELPQQAVVVRRHRLARLAVGVHADPGPRRCGSRRRRPAPGRKSRAGSSALMRHSIACPRAGATPVMDSRPPAATLSCSATRSRPGHQLGDRVLHLQARVQLEEEELALLVHQELQGPRGAVVPRLHRPQRRLLHRLARRGRQVRRRRLLDQLLVAALDGALAVAAHQRAALAVGHHLDLDVAGALQQPLHVEAAVAERRLGLALGHLERAAGGRPRAPRAACPCPLRPPPPSAGSGSRPGRRPPGPRCDVAAPGRRSPPAPAARPRARPPSPRSCRPCRSITSGDGPTNVTPSSAHASANAGFSDRKP